ncbi:transcription antitermination factor NusB [Leptobacterium sp. I13]|uniref:transcription antitermination factor NusB n=1 Tax=Leptobacterium meishanense TaxID=3128904 RepID=UPI0030EE8BF5
MLTRRHIRVKVMQSIYALVQSHNTDLDKEEKFLLLSMNDMYSLYITLLNLLVAIHKKAEEQLVISQKKYLATEEEKNPNRRLIENQVFQYLKNNNELQEISKKYKLINWELEEEYVNIIYKDIINSTDYKKYMVDKRNTFSEDKTFVIEAYKTIVATNEKLYDFIEDYKLTWVDDLPSVNTLLVKILRKLKPTSNEKHMFPKLFKDEDDKEFAMVLFRKTILNNALFQKEITGKTPNWDTDRITEMDAILLKMAICELHKFPSIPVKVTINEYLEIAKEYSTPKSSLFINGILDKLVKEYQSKNTLNKTGRGLM